MRYALLGGNVFNTENQLQLKANVSKKADNANVDENKNDIGCDNGKVNDKGFGEKQ